MNEKFFELSKEKQMNIINAGMEVFGNHEYKRAVTDDIASKAGISKGLLFYYFHNKRGLYMYLYNYCFELIKSMVINDDFSSMTDFFDLLEYGANKKASLLATYPNIMEFVMKAYYSQNEIISEDVTKDTRNAVQESFLFYFKHVDFSKFKDNVDPAYVYRMLVWMTDGYLHEVQTSQKKVDLGEVMREYHIWKDMFKKMVYKEEYL